MYNVYTLLAFHLVYTVTWKHRKQSCTCTCISPPPLSSLSLPLSLPSVLSPLSIQIFHRVMSDASSTEYWLSGMVAYYGHHYSTFCYHTLLRQWGYFDDANFRTVGTFYLLHAAYCMYNVLFIRPVALWYITCTCIYLRGLVGRPPAGHVRDDGLTVSKTICHITTQHNSPRQ